MTRAVPISVLLHAVVLVIFTVFGSYVQQPRYEPQRILKVRLAGLPAGLAGGGPKARPAPKPQDKRDAKPRPDLPPKQVASETKREKTPETPPEDSGSGTGTGTAALGGEGSGPGVSGTDGDFPFGWYLDRIQGIIASRWNPRQVGFREGAQHRCVIHFFIDRRGQIDQVVVSESSGVSLFDREALRAVSDSHLPPLPREYAPGALGVTFVFNLEPGT